MMKKKIIYGLVFVFSVFLAKGQDRQTFNVENLLPKSDSSIIYPKLKGFSGAEHINQHLKRHMEHMFDLDTSLSYYICDTDSTISVKMTIICHKGKLKSGWSDYFTFSKKTGKQLFLDDVLPNQGYDAPISNMILKQQVDQISMLRKDLTKDYEQGIIPKYKYEILMFIVDHYMLSIFDPGGVFLLTDECVMLHNGLILPYELSVYIPEFFRIKKYNESDVKHWLNENDDKW